MWAVYCMGGIEKVRRLYEDAGRDAADMYDAFQKWGKATAQDANFISRFVSAKQDLAQRAAAEGIEEVDASYMRVASAAKEIGMGDHFTVGFKLLSKWAHPTAMQMLNVEDGEKIRLQRECSPGWGAFTSLEHSRPSKACYFRSPRCCGEHCQAAKRAAADLEGHPEAAEHGQPGRLSGLRYGHVLTVYTWRLCRLFGDRLHRRIDLVTC